MKNFFATEHHIKRAVLAIACSTAFAAAVTVSHAQPAHAAKIIVPDNLPPTLVVDAPNHPFLLGKATGTQNYTCTKRVDAAGNPILDAAGNLTFAWTLFTPEATLFSDDPSDPKQLITHFFSPNPDEFDQTKPFTSFHPIRATWQHSRDTSAVWARTFVKEDAVVVDQSAVAWLKLTVVGTEPGRTGGDTLTHTTFIQRVNIVGGIAPKADTCDSLEEIGNQAFSPYTADYIFYTDQPE